MKLADVLEDLAKDKKELEDLHQEFENKKALFAGKMKDKLGIAPGETSDIFEMVDMVVKVIGYDK